MTSPFNISLTAKTAHHTGADFGMQAGGVGSQAGSGMWGDARPADRARRCRSQS